MYGRILVPLDGSRFAERAIRPAIDLANATDAQVVFVAVGHDERLGGYLRDQAQAMARAVSTVFTAEEDDPAAVLSSMTAPDTLVSLATHGRTGVRRAVVGSVAEAILRVAEEPVLLSGPVSWREIPQAGGEMLVCLDGSKRAEAILPAVRDWAKALEMHVWLAAAIGVDSSARRREVDIDVLDAGYLAATARGLGLPPGQVDWDVIHTSTPGRALAGMARRIGTAVVAMTTHGRTGLARVSLGSVAMQMVHDAPCPVLVARAPGTA